MNVVGFIIAWLIFYIPSCIILGKKNRGAGYYILAFVWPLIGFIVALCLSKKLPKDDNGTLDITETKN
jgi:Na+/melibiose symporter-like transporter